MTILAITLEYGEPLPAGCGAYDHPAGDGTTAALQIRDVAWFEDEEEAIAWGIESEKDPMVHHVDFMQETDQ